MKLLSSITLLCYFNTASAACSDNERRKHCLAETDCIWLRDTANGGQNTGGRNGRCKNTDKIDCDEIILNKRLCEQKKYGRDCVFNKSTKECVEPSDLNCSDLKNRRTCKSYGATCFYHNSWKECVGLSAKDSCTNFNNWRFGCHKVAKVSGGCVYNEGTAECKNFSDVTCADYVDSRSRCNNQSEKGCKFNNKTGECEGSAPERVRVFGSGCQTSDQCPPGFQCIENWIASDNKICLHESTYDYSEYYIDVDWFNNDTTDTYWNAYNG